MTWVDSPNPVVSLPFAKVLRHTCFFNRTPARSDGLFTKRSFNLTLPTSTLTARVCPAVLQNHFGRAAAHVDHHDAFAIGEIAHGAVKGHARFLIADNDQREFLI